MYSLRKSLVVTAFAVMFCALPAFSQTAFVQGTVTAPDGKPVVGAAVAFDRTDIKGHVAVKTDKKGHYIASMMAAAYDVSVAVDGQTVAKINKYTAQSGNGDPLDFKLPKPGEAPAAEAEPAPGPKGQGAKDDPKVKEREAQLAKNKELNDAFGAGKTAMENKQWDEAITQLTKASELGPTQPAVWALLAEAYVGSAKAAKGADQSAIYAKSFTAYDKLLELSPADAGAYNNYALALAADKKLDDAKVKLAKAVELDPPGAGKYHYNLGALLMNSNQTDGAIDEFKKAIDADPNYAEAYYYYGSTLVGKATLDQKTGNMIAPPGTVEALQKYVQLKPDGPNADSAKQLIAALGSSVKVDYKDPNAPAPKATTKKATK
jgi:tetratricopeptide (TPR) repeat protein